MDLVNSVDDSVCVKEGQKIACIDAGIASLCAFPQKNTGEICAPKLKDLINELQDHGRTNCGSIPFNHLTGGVCCMFCCSAHYSALSYSPSNSVLHRIMTTLVN